MILHWFSMLEVKISLNMALKTYKLKVIHAF
jgi:hypothetical protein